MAGASKRLRVWAGIAMLLAAGWAWAAPPAQASLALDVSQLALGKILPGHASAHEVTVRNVGEEATEIAAEVQCDCPHYVTVMPEAFSLGPGDTQQVTITVAVPMDADPGIHNNQVRFTQLAPPGSGSTGQAAQSIDATFWVASAAMYTDPFVDGAITVKLVNAYDENLTFVVTGSITLPDGSHELGPIEAVAPGSQRARTTFVSVPIPIDEDTAAGEYTATLQGSWSAPGGGPAGASGLISVPIAWGFAARMTGLDVRIEDGTLHAVAEIVNDGGAPVTAALVATVTDATGQARTGTSEPVPLVPGQTRSASLQMDATRTDPYTVLALLRFSSESGQEGESEPWPTATVQAPPDEGRGGGWELPRIGFLTIVALVGGLAALVGGVLMHRARRGG